MKSKSLVILLLTLIPLYLFSSSLFFKSKMVPYYLSLDPSPDNEYPYLLNSLNIVEFTPPGHTDHPGTPLQILGAIVIILKWSSTTFLYSYAPIVDSVLKNPESYLNAIHIFLSVLTAGAVFWGGYKIFLVSNRFSAALTFQLTMLLFPQIQASMTTVAPEHLLIFAVIMLVAGMSPLIFENKNLSSNPPDYRKIAILTGISLGFGTATKIIFLPLSGIIFLFEKSKERKIALTAAFLSFLLFTIPIIPHYPRMVKWFGSLLIHKENYGSGGYGLPSYVSLIRNFFYLISVEPFLFISLVFYLLLSIDRKITRLQLKLTGSDRIQKLLWISSLIIFAQIAVTIKHPGARYLLPAMVFTSLLNSLIVFQWQMMDKLFSLKRLMVLSALIVFLGTGFVLDFLKTQAWLKEVNLSRASKETLLTKINEFNNCAQIEYYRSSRLEYALAFGNDFSSKKFNLPLFRIYPSALFYDMWGGTFYAFNGRVEKSEIQQRLAKGECMIMTGSPFTNGHRSYLHNLDLKLISTEYDEAVYQLNGFN